jgi:RNA polymerase sigma-70 factor, ECF subfamily
MTAPAAEVRPWAHEGGPLMDGTDRRGDAELLARVAAGDQAAFAAVYDLHADVVFGSVLRFLRDRELAEEVVQDAFLAMWRNAAHYVPDAGSALGWLLGIARNKSIDRLRASARRPRLVVLGGPEAERDTELDRIMAAGDRVGGPGWADAGPEEAATRAWTAAVVRTALTAMPDAERQVLELAYDEGLTQTEIAQRLGWPLGTVKTRTRRALATLRAVLAEIPELTGSGMDTTPTSAVTTATSKGPAGGHDAPR